MPEQQRQARLLSALLLFFIITRLVSGLLLVPLRMAESPAAVLRTPLITVLSLSLVYLLSRTRYYRVAVLLTLGLLDIFAAWFVLRSGADPFILLYLFVPVLFGAIFLTTGAAVIVAFLNLGLLVVLLSLLPRTLAPTDAVEFISFYVLMSGLLFLGRYYFSLNYNQRTHLMESQLHFRTLSEKALVGVYVIQDGVFRYVNPALARIFGYSVEEIVGKLGPLDLTTPQDRDKVQANIQQRLDGAQDATHYFLTGRRKDGREVFCEVLGRRAEYRGRAAIVGTLLDISERKEAEEALRQREEQLRTYFEQANDWIFTLDASGRIASVNREMCISSGYQAEELVGASPADFLEEESVGRIQQIVQRLLQGQPLDWLEVEVPLRNGRSVWLEIRGIILRDNEGVVTGSFHIARDITERKQAEDAAREAAALYRALFEHIPIGLGIASEDGNLLAFNDAMLEPGGYSREEITANPNVARLYCDSRQRKQIWAQLQKDQAVIQEPVRFLRKDGSCYDTLMSSVPMTIKGKKVQLAVVQDVTEQKRVESAEREQRVLAEALGDTATVLNSTLELDQVLEKILENVGRVVPHDGANIMLIEGGEEARVVRCQGYYNIHGFEDEVMGLRFSVPGTKNFADMARTGTPFVVPDTHEHEAWVSLPQTEWLRSYVGAPIYLDEEVIGFLNLDSATPCFFSEQHAERLQAFAEQVAIALRNARLYHELENYSEVLEHTVRVRTVELRRTMEQLVVILQNSPDAILLLKVDGTIEMANPAFYELFGYDATEMRADTPGVLVIAEHERRLIDAFTRVVAQGRRQRLELTALRADHSTFDADVALAPVREGEVIRGAVCSMRDISNLKEIDRMKDTFVSNVSHELRTPITSLKLYHDLLLRNPQRQGVYLERLEREINRLNVIVEDLLRLSRLDRGHVDVNRQAVDLNQLAQEYIEDRLPLASAKEIALSCEPLPEDALVWADRGLLEQALSILLTNALNYTDPGGEVSVAVAQQQDGSQRRVGCRVRDTGPGIETDELPHIFERFYRGTAAETSGAPGTGLGLAIAREIIERHHGHIEVENSPQGAVFTIWLPAVGTD